jgi:hypothetical protein
MIIVYAQFSNVTPGVECDLQWFDRIKSCGKIVFTDVDCVNTTPLSALSAKWVFGNVREFPLPYIKRGWVTNSTALSSNGYAAWYADRVQTLQHALNGCKVSSQFQVLGGPTSRYKTQDTGETSWSWRQDSRICLTLDAFYAPDSIQGEPEDIAQAWQEGNDKSVGPDGTFCTQDRRLLWASWGDHNMGNVWQTYHDSADKYSRLCDIKNRFDPNGIFTPNLFCVGVPAADQQAPQVKEPKGKTDEVLGEKLLARHMAAFLARNPQIIPGTKAGTKPLPI